MNKRELPGCSELVRDHLAPGTAKRSRTPCTGHRSSAGLAWWPGEHVTVSRWLPGRQAPRTPASRGGNRTGQAGPSHAHPWALQEARSLRARSRLTCGVVRYGDAVRSVRGPCPQGVLPLGGHCLGPWVQIPDHRLLVFLHGLHSPRTIPFWNLLGTFRKIPLGLHDQGPSLSS